MSGEDNGMTKSTTLDLFRHWLVEREATIDDVDAESGTCFNRREGRVEEVPEIFKELI